MQDLTIKSLFTVDDVLCDFISRFTYPWEVLPYLKTQLEYFVEHAKRDYYFLSRGVLVHESADIDYRAVINAPCVICKNVSVRPYAYLRGGVFLGENVTVGNSTEIKNSILFANSVVPHFNYVGDSILGQNAHFGAGAITSNLKADKSCVKINKNGISISTGLIKCGAFVGDGVEIGANTVLNPGSVIGKKTRIYPLCNVRGYVDKNSIYKSCGDIIKYLED